MWRVVAVLGIVALAACSSGSPSAKGHGAVPTSYVIEYRVVTGDTTSTETLSVRRPFDGRVELRTSGGDSTASVSSFGRLLLAGAGSQTGLIAQPPAPAIGDVRPEISIDELVGEGVVKH